MYRFSQWNIDIEPNEIKVNKVIDSIETKTASVEVLLICENCNFSVTLQGFTYVSSWEDSDINAWVNLELDKNLI